MPFNQPVNTAVYTSYLDYVPNPMDFSTVGPYTSLALRC